MSTLQIAETQFVTVNGIRVAFRRFGKQSQVPLLYINHLRGSMDILDALLFNAIAKNREVIVYDSFGIGHSDGQVPESTAAMAAIAAGFVVAIGVEKADVIGFSMGGGVAQILAWDYPHLVRKLVLAGTQSAIGEGVVLPPKEVLESAGANNDEPPTLEDMLRLFFFPSDSSLAIGRQWWNRIHEHQVTGEERKGFLVGPGARSQLTAIFSFSLNSSNFDRLKDTRRLLYFSLQRNLPNAQLIIYPDAGHGHLFQVPELYAKHLDLFLGH
ncbi:unnamed protein product [Colletotrichum noveboracense]|uniref:AB hydrolase-1 domain-containing protein n=1 Tax=Colletotrichum noveboracense TaxID=2664923 RepID=A0A9W4RXN1_9PEZI|nr:unnamed protein product [Colletotrichum noveboracense]